MIKSSYPIDEALGLSWYITDFRGINGKLRSEDEDFLVEEESDTLPSDDKGKYLLCRLTKKNWDQQRAVKEIANRLSISHQRINFAGTKDKHAVTTQNITIFKGDKESVSMLHIPDIKIEPLYFVREALHLGGLKNNRFTIRIRDTEQEALNDRGALIEELENGIPNYVGYQRFGVRRPVTHIIGLSMLKGEFEEAVMSLVGMQGSAMQEDEAIGRNYYADTSDPAGALHLLPVRLSLERSVLHYLVEHPDDYLGAILSLPRTLRSMYVSAVQSFFFNKTLSARLDARKNLTDIDSGDRLLFSDGKYDIVTQGTIKSAQMQIKRGRCEPAILMPGSDIMLKEGEDDLFMKGLLEKYGLSPIQFKEISKLLEMRFAGAHRQIKMTVKPELNFIESDPLFSFDLMPGMYATTVLREIMKTDPANLA